jgi:hypothetical protein
LDRHIGPLRLRAGPGSSGFFHFSLDHAPELAADVDYVSIPEERVSRQKQRLDPLFAPD